MATPQSKQLQSDPTKGIFLDALERQLKRPENAKHQKNIQAMVSKATTSGPPKPKHTWWALDGKVYEVENKQFQQTMAKYAKIRDNIYAMVRQAPENFLLAEASSVTCSAWPALSWRRQVVRSSNLSPRAES